MAKTTLRYSSLLLYTVLLLISLGQCYSPVLLISYTWTNDGGRFIMFFTSVVLLLLLWVCNSRSYGLAIQTIYSHPIVGILPFRGNSCYGCLLFYTGCIERTKIYIKDYSLVRVPILLLSDCRYVTKL